MRTRIHPLMLIVAFASGSAALGQTLPYSISFQPSQTCFGAGSTFTIQVSGTNTTAGALTNFKATICSPATVVGATPGSANQPPGGSFTPSTCSLGGGGTFTASGNWTANTKDSVTFALATPSNPGNTLSFLFSISDATHPPASTTFAMPECSVVGPALEITKSVNQKNLSLGQARVEDLIEFDIVVTNTGTAPTSGDVTVTDLLPDGLELTNANYGTFTGGFSRVGQNGARFLDRNPIPPGSSVSCKVICRVAEAGDFVNTATVQGGGAPDKTSTPVSLTAFGPRPSPARVPVPNDRVVTAIRPSP